MVAASALLTGGSSTAPGAPLSCSASCNACGKELCEQIAPRNEIAILVIQGCPIARVACVMLRFVPKGQEFESKDTYSVAVPLLLSRRPGLQGNTLCESLCKSSSNLRGC